MKMNVSQLVVGTVSRTLLLATLLSSVVLAEENPTSAASPVLSKSPEIQAMATNMMDKTLVQDVVRVGERIFLAGARGHIGWSDDNGLTWQQAQVPTRKGINALYFVTQDVGWAVGHDGNIFNTTDGGRTWAMQLDGIAYNLKRAQERVDRYSGELSVKQAEFDEAQAELEAAQAELETQQAALEAAEAAIKPSHSTIKKITKRIGELEKKISEDEENVTALDDEVYELDFQVRDSESVLTEENAPWPLMDVWFRDLKTGFAVGAFNALLMTKDGGETWENISPHLDNPDGFHLNVIAGVDDTIIVGGEAGLLFRSTDTGETWQKLASPDDGSFFAINVQRIAQQAIDNDPEAVPALDVIITGLEGYVYRSGDSGNTWTPMEHSLRYNMNGIYLDEVSGLLLIVGNDGAIIYSTDGGKTLNTHRLISQVTLSSVTVAANGTYVLAGANGIILQTPDFKN